MTLQKGTELGKYRIIRRIGQGGMADVYEAEDMELGRKVAVKLLPPEFARDPDRVTRFIKEVRNSAALQHPNIIPIYDVGEGDGFHFYSMQLLEGGNLKQRIKAGMSPAEALAVVRQMASALGEAHARGIVHRDVKPENVMFDAGGRAILTDLGIARVASGGTRMTKTGTSIGTPHYMSPEQARGRDVDGRSDIYSLGIMLFEMLTGKVPYDAEETLAVSYKHVNEPLPMLPAEFAAHQPLLDAMLAKEPEQRYPDCAALIRDVECVERGGAAQGVPMPAAGAAPAASSPAKAAGVQAAMIGALAAVLVAGGVFWFLNHGQTVAGVRGGGGGSASAAASSAAGTGNGEQTPLASKARSSGNPLAKLFASTGIVKLTSEPSGAEVFVDGVRKGTTPLTLREVDAGTYDVQLSLAGHEDRHLLVGVTAEKISSHHVRMAYDPAMMWSLTVQVEPAEATVKILNIKPRYEPGIRLKPGRYSVQASCEGYETRAQWVELKDQDVSLAMALEKSGPGPGDTWADPVTGMEFVWVPGGCFLMGSNSGESDEKPVHRVCVDGFWMGKYEVTQAQWRRAMGNNPSRFSGERHPVETVSWNDAQAFIRKLNAKGRGGFRLPTEAEWEYAARSGGRVEEYAGGNLERGAWYASNNDGRTRQVGGKAPNDLGLYDMSGNVWEWCEDVYDSSAYSRHGLKNPRVSGGGSERVARGGSWCNLPKDVRLSNRFRYKPSYMNSYTGLRLVKIR